MSATSSTTTPDSISPASAAPGYDADAAHGSSKFQKFVNIAMILAAITGVEIVLIYLPFAKWLILTALGVLSAVKFLFVIFYFMHLKWDKMFCTILFFIGLLLAGGTVAALIAIFASGDSKPIENMGALPVPAHASAHAPAVV
ncbi:cytochrome C oxidase subunit IV [Opitutaceae bacterium TAV5]|nr:cytochrome C oxidase subunit IV [Opitutaceae bacterium TAV5]